jgi:hypothetical protein
LALLALAANIAVAEPIAVGGIAAWLSFAFIGVHELLMCQVRHSAWSPARLS